MDFSTFWKEFDNYLSSQNLKIKNYNIGSSYFIFNLGENGVVHYTIKGLSGWKFGLWIEYDEDKNVEKIQAFAQHKDNIDKFKPSCSSFCVSTSSSTWDWHKITNMIKTIKSYKIGSYIYDCNDEIYPNLIYRLFKFICKKISNKKYFFKRWCKHYSPKNLNITYLKLKWMKMVLKLFYSDCIHNVEVIDKNTKDFVVTPRFELIARWKNNDEQYLEPIVYMYRKPNGKDRYYKNAEISLAYNGENRGRNYEPITENEVAQVYKFRYKIFKRKGK